MSIRSKEEWEHLLALYENRSSTKEAFCKEHDVNPATLSYQLSKRKPSFHPLTPATSAPEAVVIEFPSGIRLSIRG